jgi:hypothetical protein
MISKTTQTGRFFYDFIAPGHLFPPKCFELMLPNKLG